VSGALLFFDGINGKNELGISFMTWDIPYNYMVIWLHRYIVIIYIYIHIYPILSYLVLLVDRVSLFRDYSTEENELTHQQSGS